MTRSQHVVSPVAAPADGSTGWVGTLRKLPRSVRSPYAIAAAAVVFGLMFSPASALASGNAPICDGYPRDAPVGKMQPSLGICSDFENDSLHITITVPPSKGVAGVDNQDTSYASVQYTASTTGPDSFKFQASDGTSASSEAIVTTNNYSGADGTPPPGTAPPPGSQPPPSTGQPGKCSKLKGRKRARCIKRRCGKLKGTRKRACVKKVIRRATVAHRGSFTVVARLF